MAVTIESRPAIMTATYLPERVLTNEQIESWNLKVTGQDGVVRPLTAKFIESKIWVLRRHIADPEETVLDMAMAAARPFLGRFKEEVGLVFFSTSYPDGRDNARELADRLGLKPRGLKNEHFACSGFTRVFGEIHRSKALLEGQRVMIACGEKYTPTLADLRGELKEPSRAQTIFGDGGNIFTFIVGQDIETLSFKEHFFKKEESQAILMPVRMDLIRGTSDFIKIPYSKNGYFWMQGREVFDAVIREVPGLIRDAVSEAGLTAEDIAQIIAHQGSGHMLKGLRMVMPDYKGKILSDLEDANLSSAAQPKAFEKALNHGLLKRGDRFVLVAFGAGMYAAVVVGRLN